MAIKGDLTTINLADIFQTLSINQKTGILKVYCGGKSKKIFLKEGEIFNISLSYSDWAFGEFLLRQGFLTGDKFSSIIDKRKEDETNTFEGLLVESGLFSYEQLEDLLTLQLNEEIYDLFTWDGGEFDFEENDEFLTRKRDGINTDTHIFINTSGLILEAARRADEMERFKEYIKSSKDIFRKCSQDFRSSATMEEDDMTVYDAVDGERDVSEIAFKVNIGIFEVYLSLFKLLRTQMIEAVPIVDMLEVGKRNMETESFSKAMKIFERVNEMDEDEPLYIRLYANALEKFGDLRMAAIQYMLLGTIMAGQRDTDEAITYYKKVLEIIPEDSMTRERLAALYEGESRKRDALAQYKVLAEVYIKNRASEDAQTALRNILTIDDEDIEARKSLAELLIDDDLLDEGIIEYEIVAGRLLASLTPEDMRAALKIFQRVVEVQPTSPELRMELGNMYMMLEMNAEAVDEFMCIAGIYEAMPANTEDGINTNKWELLIDVYRQVLAIDEENIAAKEKIANALMQIGTSDQATEQLKNIAQDLQDQGDIVRSTEFLQRVTSLEPTDLTSRFSLASNLISKGQFDEAILEYKGIAIAAKKINDLKQAEQAYQRVIELNPFEINCHKGLAEIYYKTGETEKAIEKYKSVSMICYGAGLYEPALGSYRIIRNFDPNNREIIHQISEICLKLDDEEGAVAALENLAELYEKEGNLEKTLEVCRKIVSFHKDSVPHLETVLNLAVATDNETDVVLYGKRLAGILVEADEVDQAIEVYEKIHKVIPGELQVLNDFAVLLEKQGNIARACRFYRELSKSYLQNDMLPQAGSVIEKAEKLMPDDPKIQLVLALLAARSGDLEEAEKRFARILELDPEDIVALKSYGDILARKGDIDSAVDRYHTARELLEQRGQFEEMIRIQEAVMQVRPDDVDEKMRFAEIYEILRDEIKLNVYVSDAANTAVKTGEKEKAYDMFRLFLDRNPRLDNLRRAFFNLALEQGDKALAAAEGVKLARHCTERSDYENAKVIVDYILKFAPGESTALMERDRILFEEGEIDQALDSLKESIVGLKNEDNFYRLKRHLRDVQKYVPKNPIVHETLGAIYAKEGAFDEALDEYRIAQALFEEDENKKGAATCEKVIKRLQKHMDIRKKTVAEDKVESGVSGVFRAYDKAKNKKEARTDLAERIKADALDEASLESHNEFCRDNQLEELGREVQMQLIKLYLVKNLYTKGRDLFQVAQPELRKDVDVLQLLASAAERSGDSRFAHECLNRLFREFDGRGNTELAAGVCGRILSIEPQNKKAINYLKKFVESKERLTDTHDKAEKVTRRSDTFIDEDKKAESRKLFEDCQAKLKSNGGKGKGYAVLQQKFITALTEESLGNFEESIRIFSEIMAELPE
ncbi:tetratricopeptide repeat protein [Planctomycetota bacterium]